MVKYSFILPTYNEKENIIDIVSEIENNFQDFEIIVVDDNSPDLTGKIVKEYAEKNNKNNISVIMPQTRLGLTESIKLGIKSALGEFVFWFDVDGTMRPSMFAQYLNCFDDGYDMIFFSRYVESAKDARKEKLSLLLSIIINFLCQIILSSKHKDYTSGFIGVKKQTAGSINFSGDYGEYFIELLYKCIKHNFKIKEAPYILNSRTRGETKTSPDFKTLFFRGIKYLKKIYDCRL
ncbi:MAG TPA: glycosyltransferase [bacterium]|nr:glycosyltransferase [bacterium]